MTSDPSQPSFLFRKNQNQNSCPVSIKEAIQYSEMNLDPSLRSLSHQLCDLRQPGQPRSHSFFIWDKSSFPSLSQ